MAAGGISQSFRDLITQEILRGKVQRAAHISGVEYQLMCQFMPTAQAGGMMALTGTNQLTGIMITLKSTFMQDRRKCSENTIIVSLCHCAINAS